MQDGEYHELNEMGACIWNMIQEPRPVAEILAAILEEYEVDAETCERDLHALLESLAEKGLIQVDSAESA